MAWALAATTMGSGCYLSYGLTDDAPVDGSAADAAVRDALLPRDAGTLTGVVWALVERRANVAFRNELGCTALAGGTLVVTATVPLFDACEHAGPVDLELSSDGTYLLHAYIWVESHPSGDRFECTAPRRLEERSVAFDAVAGETVVRDATSGSEARVRVVPSLGDPVCSRMGATDAPCTLDCDCSRGLRCIPGLGDAVECFGGSCGQPCDIDGSTSSTLYDRDVACPVSMACSDRGLASPTCVERLDSCGSAPCNDGLECSPLGILQRCDWTLRLSAETRHPCMDERDCLPGMHCVEHGDASRARTCEVPCMMNTMSCPFMHTCQGFDSGWVCEWVGE